MKYKNIREEELKIKVSQDYFENYDCSKIIGNVDFCVCILEKANKLSEQESLLWAEAKRESSDVYESFVQLILTIGKARTFNEILPPPFLGAFDGEKFAFVPYSDIQDIFYQNDFNWKVTPSNHQTKEFKLIYEKVSGIIDKKSLLFNFEKDDKELKQFIRENFIIGKTETSKIRIDKNNFLTIYLKWLDAVKPTIGVNWDKAKKLNILDCDFYLADLISKNNISIKKGLQVLLEGDFYKFVVGENELGEIFQSTDFNDNKKAHTQFWAKYERPPLEEYRDFMIDHRHLLVPQDIRERKGSFYTPPQWVELSQKYLADVFGEDWQEEYYVWDCCAGTGNLLAGLINNYNIWASTIDKADVAVMNDRIKNGANLLEKHVFQFDFLNDEFLPKTKGGKLPDDLYNIINDPKLRKKLIIYINPPYAEATNYIGNTKSNVAKINKIYNKYKTELDGAMNELFGQFFIRIYKEIPDSQLAAFSKLKYISAPNFKKFRTHFKATFKKGFICNASTFDNVNGKFPIGFLIYDLKQGKEINSVSCNIYDNDNKYIGVKKFYSNQNCKYLNEWITSHKNNKNNIGFLNCANNSFQNQKYVWTSIIEQNTHCTHLAISVSNIIVSCIYFAVRHCIAKTWLNDRDQFLYPNNKWKKDTEFQNDCLTFTLFHNQNRISAKHGVNHWIPFSEREVNAGEKFDSHFMLSFISGKIVQNGYTDLFERKEEKLCIKREFSPEATAVFDAGRELWKYYHSVISSSCGGGRVGTVNASLYDIREYFQGRNEKGTMKNKSTDTKYNELIDNLRDTLKILANKIEPKVYEYEFLN